MLRVEMQPDPVHTMALQSEVLPCLLAAKEQPAPDEFEMYDLTPVRGGRQSLR